VKQPADPYRPTRLRGLIGRWEARDIAPVVSLLLLVIFFSLVAPGFFRIRTMVTVLEQGSVLAITAAGLTFVLLCAEIDLSVGTMAVWSACLCGWLSQRLALGTGDDGPAALALLALAVLVPLATCLLLGLLSGLLTVWSRLPSFIISLAMMFIAEGLAVYLTRGATYEIPGLLYELGNGDIHVTGWFKIPYSAVLAVAVFLVGHVVLQYTRFGRYVLMTGGNREAARLAGVRTGRIVVACLAICALTAGISGLVNAGRLNEANTDQNADLLLSAVACVVLGGTSLFGGEGSMGKTVVGVLTFTVLSIGLNMIDWIDDLARQMLTGAVLMVALVINGVLAKGK